MKKAGLILIFLIIFISISVVNAEDTIGLDDSLNMDDDLLVENVSHSHDSVSNVVVVESVISASGGTFSQLQTIIDGASSGDVISFTGDYTYDSSFTAEGISISKQLTFDGNGHKIDGCSKARIFKLTSAVTIKDMYFYNGYYSLGAGISLQSNVNINISNVTFVNNTATEYGGAIKGSYGRIYIDNCLFINNTAINYGGGAICIDYTDYYIFNSSFLDNKGSSYGAAIWNDHAASYVVNRCIFLDDLSSSGGREIYSNGNNNFNDNWWGTNTPNFSQLCYGFTPSTWAIMDFKNLDSCVLGTSGGVTLEASLNSRYNSSSGIVSSLNGDLPIRYVSFKSNGGVLSSSGSNFINSTSTILSYSSVSSNFKANATIDKQTLTIGLVDLDLNIIPSTFNPQITSKFQITVNITNNGVYDISSLYGDDILFVNFTIPYPLIFINSAGDGIYNNTAGVWNVGNLSVGKTKSIIFTVQVPLNQSLIGSQVQVNATAYGRFFTVNSVKDSETLNIRNKTSGSFTELQELIDNTPVGGILDVPYDVIYDPLTDGWLQDGMRLNKTFALNGTGHNINGDGKARIFKVTSGVNITNIILLNGYYSAGSAISLQNDVRINLTNITFINNTATEYGGAIKGSNGYMNISNCYFINNTAINYGGGAICIDYTDYTIYNCSFLDNKGSSYGAAIWNDHPGKYNVTNCIFMDNLTSSGGLEIDSEGVNNYNNNWWGTNTPNFNTLCAGFTPETWIIMGFSGLNTYTVSTSGGNIQLKSSLNRIYNKTGNFYTNLNGDLPTREIKYTTNHGSLNVTQSNITLTDYVSLNYPNNVYNLEINATIDKQILTLHVVDLNLTIVNVSRLDPQIGDLVTFTINVTNNGPWNINYAPGNGALIVNFTLPSPLNYISYNGDGTYNSTDKLWYVGNLTINQTKTINISARIPFNYSYVGLKILVNTSLTNPSFLTTNKFYDNTTLTITNKTTGSYTDLQTLIDNTPNGGTLNLGFNVTYNPIGDAWLQEGMRLNKTITLNGNGFTINGTDKARIFSVSQDNVKLKDLICINGIGFLIRTNYYSGGAIYSNANNITIINSTFKNNYATTWGSAIEHWGPDNSIITIINSTFINNTANRGGGAVCVDGGKTIGYITGCLFENNTGASSPAMYTSKGYVNYNAFVNNYAGNGIIVYDESNSNLDNNWWGTNNPKFNTIIGGGVTPETYVIMNFTNITPITYNAGTSTLQVNLNTIYNTTLGDYTQLTGGTIPTRTIYYGWTTGNINPNITTITEYNTTTFTYSANMDKWTVNATIDNQTLWIGSSDIGIIITPNKNPINDGENITYTVTVTNNGPMNATNINVTLYLPNYGLNITNITNNTGYWNETKREWYIGNLTVGQNATLIINGTITDPGPYLTWNATIKNVTDYYDHNFTNNTYISNLTVIQWSDLEITKNVSNMHPDTKDNITYTITVYNHGPSTATNITVFDNLSSKLIYLNSTATNGIYNNTTCTWLISNITPGGNETLNITVFINQSGITDNFANITCPNNDTNWTNNYANISFETASLSNLWVTINMEPQTSNYITYHIQAGNNGIEPANGTIVILNLSNLYIQYNHTTDKGTYNNLTNIWDIGYLEVNETVNMTLIVRLDFPTGTTFANVTTCVNITSWSTDLYMENNTDNVTFEAEIFGNFRLLQDIIDNWAENTTQILPRSFAYDPILDAKWEGETYNLIDGVRLYKNITIINPNSYTLSGFNTARIFNISADNIIIDGLKFYNGNSPIGGAINIRANNIQILRSNFIKNTLYGDYGGAIFTNGANTLIQNNNFIENDASKLGGAIGAVQTTNLKIISNTFTSNTVQSDSITGGAIGVINSTNTIINYNVFLDNKAVNYDKGHIMYIENTNANLDANWYGVNNPDLTSDTLIYYI